MKPAFVIPFMGLLLFSSCIGKPKQTGIPIYIEVEEMDPALEKCFTQSLYGKWASVDDFKLHDMKEKYQGENIEDKHVFKSYNDFDASKDTAGTEKLMVKVYGDGTGDTATTFFQLRRYELASEGIWTESLNLGNFRMQDRPNDHINPGKVDEEEICDMMVKFCVKASFK